MKSGRLFLLLAGVFLLLEPRRIWNLGHLAWGGIALTGLGFLIWFAFGVEHCGAIPVHASASAQWLSSVARMDRQWRAPIVCSAWRLAFGRS
jgi:hypothetical protein